MPTLKRNHRQILAARALNGRRTRYRIEGVKGLWLSVGASGAKTWVVRYQPGTRKSRTWRWHKIGDAKHVGLRDALQRADEILRRVTLDERDPSAERAARRCRSAWNS